MRQWKALISIVAALGLLALLAPSQTSKKDKPKNTKTTTKEVTPHKSKKSHISQTRELFHHDMIDDDILDTIQNQESSSLNDDQMRRLARGIRNMESRISKGFSSTKERHQWMREYTDLQNAYFSSQQKTKGIQTPTKQGQKKLANFQDQATGLGETEAKQLKQTMLLN